MRITLVALALVVVAWSPMRAAEMDPWLRADGPWSWVFPRDHGAHPGFKTEWWYFTGNLRDAAQRRFGYQLTIFRQGVQFTPAQTQSHWAVRDFYFGHFAISDVAGNGFHAEEKVSRGALGEARAAEGQMDVAIGNWTIRQDADESIEVKAEQPEMGIDLRERPLKPLVLEGVNGLSRKAQGAGQASYYYSYPRLASTGRLRLNGQTFEVSGLSWFDHEFSTSSLGPDEAGWDWFCFQLDNNEEVMLYAMRDKSGAIDPVSEGTWIGADGKAQRLPPGSFSIARTGAWHSAATGATYPAGWHVLVPSHGADLTIAPALADQELRLAKMGALDYWEGACSTKGTVAGRAVTGEGYTELTGYAGTLQTDWREK
jgi:predicted secreted hydrolase